MAKIKYCMGCKKENDNPNSTFCRNCEKTRCSVCNKTSPYNPNFVDIEVAGKFETFCFCSKHYLAHIRFEAGQSINAANDIMYAGWRNSLLENTLRKKIGAMDKEKVDKLIKIAMESMGLEEDKVTDTSFDDMRKDSARPSVLDEIMGEAEEIEKLDERDERERNRSMIEERVKEKEEILEEKRKEIRRALADPNDNRTIDEILNNQKSEEG